MMNGEDVENIMRKDYNTYENLELPKRVLKKFLQACQVYRAKFEINKSLKKCTIIVAL